MNIFRQQLEIRKDQERLKEGTPEEVRKARRRKGAARAKRRRAQEYQT